VSDQSNQANEFEAESKSRRTGLFAEFWEFIKTNKKWWLTPIILVMLLVGAMVILGGGAAAPFIYTLF